MDSKWSAIVSNPVAIVAAVTVTLIVALLFRIRGARQEPPPPPESIATADQFSQALNNDALILHFDVDWSMTAVQSRPVVLQLNDAIHQDPQLEGIVLRRIDCTRQRGELWSAVGGWLWSQDADGSVMGAGNGAVVWVKSGKVVGSVGYAAGDGVEKLLEVTRRVF